jgi:hypothetical protein
MNKGKKAAGVEKSSDYFRFVVGTNRLVLTQGA